MNDQYQKQVSRKIKKESKLVNEGEYHWVCGGEAGVGFGWFGEIQHVKFMIESELLCQWGIWFIYQGESYEGNVQLITTVSKIADVVYLWSHSPIASLPNYFLNPNNRQNAYQVGDTQKRVNSIQYFRKGIEPKWEDERNQNGGRFIFQISKTQTNKEEIYQQLTFFFLGENFERSDKVNGFRFISSKVNNPSSYRFEIWVSFDEEDTESIIIYQNVLTALFKQLGLNEKIQFKQMKTDAAKEKEREAARKEKQDKELHEKETKEKELKEKGTTETTQPK